jgi:hypothetical protein
LPNTRLYRAAAGLNAKTAARRDFAMDEAGQSLSLSETAIKPGRRPFQKRCELRPAFTFAGDFADALPKSPVWRYWSTRFRRRFPRSFSIRMMPCRP